MNRRDLLARSVEAAGSLAGLGYMLQSSAAVAANAPAASPESTNPYAKIIESSNHCVTTALACTAHCQKELSQGNKMMADCLQSVLELTASCEALMKLASYQSAYTKDFAKVTSKICAACAKLCEKHSHHMQVCKDCMEACLECQKACEAA